MLPTLVLVSLALSHASASDTAQTCLASRGGACADGSDSKSLTRDISLMQMKIKHSTSELPQTPDHTTSVLEEESDVENEVDVSESSIECKIVEPTGEEEEETEA